MTDTPETPDPKRDALTNRLIPATLAIVATIMAIFQLIAGAQGDDEVKGTSEIGSKWAYFQAKSTKEHVVTVARDQLKVLAIAMPTGADEAKKLIAQYDVQIATYEKEKAAIEVETKAAQAENDLLGRRGDRYDVSSAIFSIALAFLALAQLRGSRPIFLTSIVLSAFATALGLWGLLLR